MSEPPAVRTWDVSIYWPDGQLAARLTRCYLDHFENVAWLVGPFSRMQLTHYYGYTFEERSA